jgi:hypothetical protein
MTFSSFIDWSLLYRLAKAGELPVTEHTIKKIRRGKQRFTDDTCIAIHRLTNGSIPCWVTGWDRWQVGQVPPALAGFALPPPLPDLAVDMGPDPTLDHPKPSAADAA